MAAKAGIGRRFDHPELSEDAMPAAASVTKSVFGLGDADSGYTSSSWQVSRHTFSADIFRFLSAWNYA
jgi:hypothetical protein